MLFGNQNGRNDLGDIDAVAITLLKSIKKKQFVKMEEKTLLQKTAISHQQMHKTVNKGIKLSFYHY